MQHVKYQWLSARPIEALEKEAVTKLGFLKHKKQPFSSVFAFFSEGHAMRISTEMVDVGYREEVGRLVFEDVSQSVLKSIESPNYIFKVYNAENWMNRNRTVKIYSYMDKNYSVDTRIEFGWGGRTLVVAASSFPTCLEIESNFFPIDLCAETKIGFSPEFSDQDIVCTDL